jgi:ribosomal-protein-alanine N-acetyltransferase
VTLPLATPRLTLREFTADDLDALTAVYADPKVLWWEPAPFSREQTEEALALTLAHYRDDGIGLYAVVLALSAELVGACGPVYREIDGRRLPELGWQLRSDHWGQGYATEAARGVLVHAASLGLPRLYSLIAPHNVRSQGVARRLGMSIERQTVWAGVPHDLWSLDLA